VELRPWVWMEMSGATQRMRASMPGYFQAMLQRGEVSSECAHQIELVRNSPSLLTVFVPQNGWILRH